MKPVGGAAIASYTFTTAAVRDLAWACFSPALIRCDRLPASANRVANCGLLLTPERRDWLAQLDREPERLHHHLAAGTSHRLGIYFERLWHFFLGEDPAVELLAVNLPIRAAGQTLGEFDVIYFCRERRRHIHLELAVKYYMGLPGGPSGAAISGAAISGAANSRWCQWLGPNSRDRLDLKLNHMLDRQIRLSEQPAARPVLAAMGATRLSRELEMKGYLFQALNQPLPPPLAYNEKCSLCGWLSIGELSREPELMRGSKFLPLQRLQWLAPAAGRDQPGLSRPELLRHLHQHFASNRDALLVAQLNASGDEIDRTFIAPDQWPQTPEHANATG